MVLIYTNVGNKEVAHTIGHKLLEKRLIACYSLIPIESSYWWKDKIETAQEVQMILKTNLKHFDTIEEVIQDDSGYETPEIIAIDPEKVHTPYLQWVQDEVSD